MRTISAANQAEIERKGRLLDRVHLLDIQLGDGTIHYWSNHAGVFPAKLGAGNQTYKPWIKTPPTIRVTRSLRADGGSFSIQNLSGNSIEREVEKLIKAKEFEGAYIVYRPFLLSTSSSLWEFHGTITEQTAGRTEILFRILQLFNPNAIPAKENDQGRHCHWRFGSGQCGYERDSLFLAKTAVDIFSSTTIGNSGLSLVPDLYKYKMAVIVSGTGAIAERKITSNTATTCTVEAWGTNPDATSSFVILGRGKLIVSFTTADIFSSTTIGKTGAGWTVDAYKAEAVFIVAGTGAGQRRLISSNSATTLTVGTAWTTTPDGTSIFVVIYSACAKTRAACVSREVIERFSGFPQLSPTVVNSPTSRVGRRAGGLDDPGRGNARLERII